MASQELATIINVCGASIPAITNLEETIPIKEAFENADVVITVVCSILISVLTSLGISSRYIKTFLKQKEKMKTGFQEYSSELVDIESKLENLIKIVIRNDQRKSLDLDKIAKMIDVVQANLEEVLKEDFAPEEKRDYYE